MEIFEVPIFDDDLFGMLFRLGINTLFISIIVRYLYYRNSHNKEFLFTYFMVSIVVFFICFTLKKFELEMGMALGLFAIFAIIRYRTDPIPIKEMTYLFIVIGVSVINALANQKMSYLELAVANIAIASSAGLLEAIWFKKGEAKKSIVFEEIALIKPENYQDLKSNLEKRTGLRINRVEVHDIDFLKDTAMVTIYYHPHRQNGNL